MGDSASQPCEIFLLDAYNKFTIVWWFLPFYENNDSRLARCYSLRSRKRIECKLFWGIADESLFPIPFSLCRGIKTAQGNAFTRAVRQKSLLWLSSTIHSLYCNYGLLLTFKSLLPDWDIYRNKTFLRHDFWHWHLFDTTSSGGVLKHQDPPLHSQSSYSSLWL